MFISIGFLAFERIARAENFTFPRLGISSVSNSTDQEQNDSDNQDDTEDTAREIAPVCAVAPFRQCADQHQNQDD